MAIIITIVFPVSTGWPLTNWKVWKGRKFSIFLFIYLFIYFACYRAFLGDYNGYVWCPASRFTSPMHHKLFKLKRKYRQHFIVKVSPSINVIRNLITCFESTGSISDLPRRGSHRILRTDAAVGALRQSVLEVPSAPTCRRSPHLGIIRISLQKTLQLDS